MSETECNEARALEESEPLHVLLIILVPGHETKAFTSGLLRTAVQLYDLQKEDVFGVRNPFVFLGCLDVHFNCLVSFFYSP